MEQLISVKWAMEGKKEEDSFKSQTVTLMLETLIEINLMEMEFISTNKEIDIRVSSVTVNEKVMEFTFTQMVMFMKGSG